MARNRSTPEENQGRGCFAWLFRAKKAVNERWGRARNALRRRLARDNKLDKPLTAEDMVNETGCPDLVMSKIPVVTHNTGGSTVYVREYSPVMDNVSVKLPSCTGAPKVQQGAQVGDYRAVPIWVACGSDGNPDPQQVRAFVINIIDQSVKEIKAKSPETVSDTVNGGQTVIMDISKDGQDNVSMTSSVISAIAGDVVNHSLTNILNDPDTTTMPVVHDSSSLSSGAISVLAGDVVHHSLTNILNDPDTRIMPVINDNSSLSSGAISAMAEAAVTESLTSILTYTSKNDVNHSARSRPRTVTEMLETLSIDPTIGQLCEDGDFPPCSP